MNALNSLSDRQRTKQERGILIDQWLRDMTYLVINNEMLDNIFILLVESNRAEAAYDRLKALDSAGVQENTTKEAEGSVYMARMILARTDEYAAAVQHIHRIWKSRQRRLHN